MTVRVRAYVPDDWEALVEIHDAARLDELRSSVGVEAFKDLESTYESEELFAGDVWVAEVDGQVAGFLALSDDEVTWTYVHPAATAKAWAPHCCDTSRTGRVAVWS
jgi:hypothetical protein